MSIEEDLVQNAAEKMIERYEGNALIEIDLRITELESHQQAEVLKLWKKIRNRVILILNTPSSGSIH